MENGRRNDKAVYRINGKNVKRMLNTQQKNQVKELFKDLKASYTFNTTIPSGHTKREELIGLLNDLSSCSEKISFIENKGSILQVKLFKNKKDTGAYLRGIPTGHEFSSLLLCILNCEGKGKNISNQEICERIRRIHIPFHITTYISIECNQCSDVVQSLNAITILNNHITHEIVEGSLYKMEIIEKHIVRLPTVFVNGNLFHVGSGDMNTLLSKLEYVTSTY